ncbi:hypothetical protein [Streptomyces sp. DZ1-3]|uniref:hypothetical protein n=1 Tax=Streptomyces sp. DZ1-3 TaxID=3417466 RepID=UPI003CF65B1B
MRRPRAAATVLLAWALLFLLAPGSSVLTDSPANRAGVAVAAVTETAGEAGPGEGESAHRHAAVRAPRAAGPSGADDRGTARAARADARLPDGTRSRRPCPPPGGPAGAGARDVRELQTFRC